MGQESRKPHNINYLRRRRKHVCWPVPVSYKNRHMNYRIRVKEILALGSISIRRKKGTAGFSEYKGWKTSIQTQWIDRKINGQNIQSWRIHSAQRQTHTDTNISQPARQSRTLNMGFRVGHILAIRSASAWQKHYWIHDTKMDISHSRILVAFNTGVEAEKGSIRKEKWYWPPEKVIPNLKIWIRIWWR